ncbi:MAG: NAD(+)/NADH kinase [Novosphingobium sp.]|nr:NAD(+)/NADH kinase [Novosphingobium sp.]
MEPASHAPDRIADAGKLAAPPAMRIGVVRNPRSHRNRGFSDGMETHPELMFTAPATREELTEALADFAARGLDLLIIDGGDGTVRDVLTRGGPIFGDNWPPMLVLPKGKTNALAVDLDMPSRMTLEDALASIPAARRVARRPMLIERQDETAPPVMGFILGAGVFNAAIDAGQVAHRFGAFQGFAVAVTAGFGVIQALFGFGRSRWRELVRMRILTGAERSAVANTNTGTGEERFASGFSTLDDFPLGMKPFADHRGGIRYLVLDRPRRRAMALAPAILMGLDKPWLEKLGVHRGAAEEIELDLGGRFILDGEAFPPGDYCMRLGPELTFLVP